jgi:cell division protein FtsB
VDHQLDNPQRVKPSPETSRESFTEQLRSFFRRNALWFLVVALAWLLVQDIFGAHGVLAMHRSQIELQKIQHELDQLNSENDKLKNNVKDLQTDRTTNEKAAREDLRLAKPGEFVFKTHPKAADSPIPSPASKP